MMNTLFLACNLSSNGITALVPALSETTVPADRNGERATQFITEKDSITWHLQNVPAHCRTSDTF